jgi:P pilus assembly chaperone PapD
MILPKKFSLIYGILFLTHLLVSAEVYAFSINPMFISMKPAGAQTRALVTVTNSAPKPMPVRASVSELVMDANGQTKSIPNSNDFIVFPPQAIIAPRGKQSFRVQWRGQPNLPQGKTYELTVAQVLAKDNRPQNDKKETSIQIQLAMAFGAIINMPAATGKPNPVVQSSRISRNKQGKPVLETVISNNSNQNFMLVQADSTVTVLGANNQPIWTRTYKPDDIMRNFGLGMVQPNKSRQMQIPLPELPANLASQAKAAKLEIRPSAK